LICLHFYNAQSLINIGVRERERERERETVTPFVEASRAALNYVIEGGSMQLVQTRAICVNASQYESS